MKLTLFEIELLFNELNGVLDAEKKQRSGGILSKKLTIKTKYILQNELNKKISEEMKSYEDAIQDIFKELGKQDGQMIQVGEENREELKKRLNELSSIQKEIEIPNIDVEELFDIKTEEYYPILLDKLLKREKQD